MRFYAQCRGEVSGPFAPAEVARRLRDGRLAAGDAIWVEGTTDTIPVSWLVGDGGGQAEADFDEVVLERLKEISGERTVTGPSPFPQYSWAAMLAVMSLPGIAAVILLAAAAFALVGITTFIYDSMLIDSP